MTENICEMGNLYEMTFALLQVLEENVCRRPRVWKSPQGGIDEYYLAQIEIAHSQEKTGSPPDFEFFHLLGTDLKFVATATTGGRVKIFPTV